MRGRRWTGTCWQARRWSRCGDECGTTRQEGGACRQRRRRRGWAARGRRPIDMRDECKAASRREWCSIKQEEEGGGGWAVACARRVCGGVMGRHVARGGRRQWRRAIDGVAVASGRGRGAAGAGEQLSKAQAVEACGAVRRGERRRAAELCCRRVVVWARRLKERSASE